jgi:prepilin-type N-terminal cleavage/methylation domain-containing protein
MPHSHTHELRRGLTLTELVVVLAILATLGSLLLPAVGHFVNDSRGDVTRASLARLREVICLYWNDNRQLPQPNSNVSLGRMVTPPGQNQSIAPAQVRYLFVNPATEDTTVTFNPVYKLGWRGPYVVNQGGAVYMVMDTTTDPTARAAGVTSDQYGVAASTTPNGVTIPGDPAVLDGWGDPIVIQNPSAILPGGTLPDGGQDVRLVSAGPNGVVDTPPWVLTSALTAGQTGDDIVVSFEVR